ncbi:MAG: recombinase family protein, partial [Planctomycetes bacterium]|nr:recombinase family protein [Planctomycetota bacterium]
MAKAKKSSIRFAALVRVSTEKQEKQGESLRTQRLQIEAAVEQIDGTIVEWYGGQEHATPGHEKQEVDRLLHDATRGRFNAVIVVNADRWSRDNAKSRQGLEVLKTHGIKFFVGTSEYNLHTPEHVLFLGMSAVIGQFQASHQNKKSIENRIERAKRGIPTGGKLPYGRTFDREKEQWGVDEAKQKLIAEVARRYLAGESMAELATEKRINHSFLHKVLTQRCGTSWQLEFNSDDLNIHETVEIQIPRLLDEKTI